ncbi:MAG: hypothetical protein ACNFW9_00530 [Candidatus Kerfeldbacteria bacterium]
MAKKDFVLRGKKGNRQMFHKITGNLIGEEDKSGQWTGPSDGPDALTVNTPELLRSAQKAASEKYL